jgi:hypothetical protein
MVAADRTIAADRHQYVEDLPMLIDCSLQVGPAAGDLHVGLVDERAITGYMPNGLDRRPVRVVRITATTGRTSAPTEEGSTTGARGCATGSAVGTAPSISGARV